MAEGVYVHQTEGYPLLSASWHPARNGDLVLESFLSGSEKKVWWICEKGHVWQASVASRVKGCGCPYCANRRVLPGFNDLETTNPALADQWHPEKNGNLTPRQVTQGTRKSVWWRCGQGHAWQAVIADRNSGNGCPYCANKRVQKGYNDLQTTDPTLALEWDFAANGDWLPETVTRGSHKKAWWRCLAGHHWQAEIKSRASGMGCPYCSNQRVLPGYNDLRTKMPALADQWHPTKNGALAPERITAGSNRKVWWQCARGHTWAATISSRVHGSGCPSCAKKRVEAGENDLRTVAPELLDQWHPAKNIGLTPEMVAHGSHRKVWWLCSRGHAWQATVKNRLKEQGCPICSNKRVELGYNDLQTRYPELASEWDPEKNGTLLPNQVVYGSHRHAWWKCRQGHSWRTSVVSRTRGGGCPVCAGVRKVSFPEKAIVYYLKGIFPDLRENVTRANLTWLGRREIDIYIPSLRLGIEYDGPRHTLALDQRKNALCAQNNVRLIRIRDDILPDDPSGSVNIRHNSRNDRSLEQAIGRALQWICETYSISAAADVNLHRDRTKIRCLLGSPEDGNIFTCDMER